MQQQGKSWLEIAGSPLCVAEGKQSRLCFQTYLEKGAPVPSTDCRWALWNTSPGPWAKGKGLISSESSLLGEKLFPQEEPWRDIYWAFVTFPDTSNLGSFCRFPQGWSIPEQGTGEQLHFKSPRRRATWQFVHLGYV